MKVGRKGRESHVKQGLRLKGTEKRREEKRGWNIRFEKKG